MTRLATVGAFLPAALAMALTHLPASAKADRGKEAPAPAAAAAATGERASDDKDCTGSPRGVFDRVFQRLSRIASDGANAEPAQRVALFKIFNRTFSTERLARASVGRHWDEISAPARERYLDLFHFYFMETYLPVAVRAMRNRLDHMTVRHLDNGETVIALDIAGSDRKAVPIRIHVAPAACRLGLVNVRIDGILLTEILGAQFQSVARRQGMDGLLGLLLGHVRASPAWERWQARR